MTDTVLYNSDLAAYSGEAAIQDFARRSRIAARNKVLSNIKIGIWIYFWLLIFEGALRKWILPGLATPLLLVRDPIAIWLILYGYLNGFLRANFYVVAVIFITAIAFITTLLTGHGSVPVALYGARIIVVHFPLVFLISQVFTQADIIKMGKVLLLTAIFQTLIATFQFYSPQSAWINKGIGGEEVKGFTGGLGYFRPPGTFSFTNGLSAYYGLIAAFVFYFWLKGGKVIAQWLLIGGTLALLIAIPISISRTVLYEVGLSAIFTFIVAARKPKMLVPFTGAIIGLVAIFILLSNLSFFKTGVDAFTERFTSATATESQGQELGASSISANVYLRFFNTMFGIFSNSGDFPFFGLGLGFGTNAGAQYLTGKATFTITEAEWGRVIGEMGVLLGMLFIILRVSISISTVTKSYRALRFNKYLPWLLSSFTFAIFIQGQWAQPTALGFAVLGMGLNLAALQAKSETR